MNRNIRGAAFAAAPFLLGTTAHAQWSNAYTAPRNAVVDANGARLLQVEASAGSLRVEGRAGLRQVQVRGTARSSSQDLLGQIKIIAERRGDVVFIKSDMPDEEWRSSRDNHSAALDLVIEVPQGMNADVADGSGELEIVNVGSLELLDGSGEITIESAGGAVAITDGSGSVTIDNVRGDVRVSDGSGDINVRNVTGSFTVRSDGSGGISANDIRGSVIVENDGSGEIEATKVGKDFTVESKGSGSINYRQVSGQVDIPARHRRDRDYNR
jgi:DUF4097 and DUF4098 domain-containing protein YvlB